MTIPRPTAPEAMRFGAVGRLGEVRSSVRLHPVADVRRMIPANLLILQ
ncbi:hypothetical protein [Microvirgula aerodenitrificans]|nr:hypothetical protein [Microvirgula aerodenitrificans]